VPALLMAPLLPVIPPAELPNEPLRVTPALVVTTGNRAARSCRTNARA
jgi:hypothetical protein